MFFESDDQVPKVPSKTRDLAIHAAQGVIDLAVITSTLPPEYMRALTPALNTYAKMAVHVMATVEEGGECTARIEKRAEEMLLAMKAQAETARSKHQDVQHGAIMRQIFESRPEMGFHAIQKNRDTQS